MTDCAPKHPPPLRAALFDLGDTLVQCAEQWPQLQARALSLCHEVLSAPHRRISMDRLSAVAERAVSRRARELAAANRAFPAGERVTMVLQALGVEPQSDLVDQLVARLYQPVSECSRALPQARSVLAELQAVGLRLGLISNTPWDVPGEFVDRDLERFGLREYFDSTIYSDCGYRKPHPEIFRRALESLEVEPSQAIMVGDSLAEDIAGAAALGMRTLWLATGAEDAPPGSHPRPDLVSRSLGAAAEVLLTLVVRGQ
jgi:HAD superfamily hydrolase (TIGR01662 family)